LDLNDTFANAKISCKDQGRDLNIKRASLGVFLKKMIVPSLGECSAGKGSVINHGKMSAFYLLSQTLHAI